MKTHLKYAIVLIISALTAYSCNPKAEAGVEINGITWATANISAPGKFTSDDFWPGTHQDFHSCFVADNPCPKGWKIPGYKEFAKLTDSASVSCEWNSAPPSEEPNGEEKCGLIFTDLATGQVLFLPAAGMIDAAGEPCDEDMGCFYWSHAPQPGELPEGMPTAKGGGYFLHFNWDAAAKKGALPRADKNLAAQFQFTANAPQHQYSVRCVKETAEI